MKNKEELTEVIEYLFRANPEKSNQERKIKGFIDINDYYHCGNEQCFSCNACSEALKNQVKLYTERILSEKQDSESNSLGAVIKGETFKIVEYEKEVSYRPYIEILEELKNKLK